MGVKLHGRPVEAVTFDFWWTLFKDVNGRADTSVLKDRLELISRIASFKCKKPREADVEEAYYRARKYFENQHRMGNFTTPSELTGKIFEFLGIELTKPESHLISQQISYLGVFSELELSKGAKEILSFLKEKDIKIGLISDTVFTLGRYFVTHLRRHGILHFFDVLVFSDEIGAVKPQKEIFQVATKRLKVMPERLLRIGDFPWSDIEGALRCGALACQYTGANGPEKDKIHPGAHLVIENFREISLALS